MRILRNYSIGQRYMAYFLLGSLLLQSCYNPAIPPKQVGIVEEVKVPSMVLDNLKASSLGEETLLPSIEIKQGPIPLEQERQGIQLENSSKLETVPSTTHQPSFPQKKLQGLSARKPVLTRGHVLQQQKKLMESRQSSEEKAPLSANALKKATKVVEVNKSSHTISHPCAPLVSIDESKKAISSGKSTQKTSFANTLQGIYSQARSSFTKKVNAFSAFLSQEIKEVSALVNMPTVFQINFAQDKAFWRAHYQSEVEELKTNSYPSLAAQQELMEKQDLVWNGLLSPYEYQAGLQELASSWPAALLQTIQDEWERRLEQQPALLESFLLDDLRTCFQDNLQSTWSIETFQDILSFYGQRMNALDYKAQLVYVREAVIKNKSSNVLTIGEEKELVVALNAAIERSSKLERRRLKEERRRFYAQAKELPFFFADEEVSPLSIWKDVAEVNQEKDIRAEEETHTKGSSSSYELSPSSLLKSLGKGLMRGIDFAVKHPLEAVVMGLSVQVAAAAAINAFRAPKDFPKTNRQDGTLPEDMRGPVEGSHEGANEKAHKQVSHRNIVKRALGDEFQINQVTAGTQQNPSLTSFASGNAFVTWVGSPTGNDDIYGRVFDPSGMPLNNEFPINQNTTGNQGYPSLTSLASGNAFVTWLGDQTGNQDIYGRVFYPNGTAVSNEFPINQNTTGTQQNPSLTSLASGNAFVTWHGYQTGNYDIYGRVFYPNGTAFSNEFPINQNTTGNQQYPSLTSLTNGNVFVTWMGDQTGNQDIYGRVFYPNGTAFSNDFPINQNTTGNQGYPCLTSLASGNAFVTWLDSQTGNQDIYGRVFYPNGTAFSNEFPINQNTTGNQQNPSLTSLASGNVFVTWEGSQTGNYDIYGRVFDPNGTAVSNEFPINQNTTGSQLGPSLTRLPSGNAFVTWQGSQTGNFDIYGRILTASFLSAFGSTTGEVTTNQLTTAQLTTNGLTTGGVTTNQLTTAQVTTNGLTRDEVTTNQVTTAQANTNGLTTGTPTTRSFQTTGPMSTTAFGESQPSQERGSLVLGVGIGVGFGGAALLTLGSIAAWKYITYKRAQRLTSQSANNVELQKRTDYSNPRSEKKSSNSPFAPTSEGYTSHPTVVGALFRDTYAIWKTMSLEEESLVQPLIAKKIPSSGSEFVLGRGNFGATYVGSKVETEELYAIKEVYGKNAVEESQQEGELQHELKDCPQVMTLVDYRAFEPKGLTDQPRLFQVMPLAYTNGGAYKQMLSCLKDKNHHKSLVFDTLHQVMKGLAYMHDKGIYHLDMKGENILYMQDGTLRIGDFGRARKLGNNDQITDHRLGDRRFFSPEQFAFIRHLLKERGETIDSFPAWAADTWGAGLYTLELLLENNPLSDANAPYHTKLGSWTNETFQNKLNSIPVLQDETPTSFEGVLRRVLAVNFKDRLKPAQAMKKVSSLKILTSQERTEAFRRLISLQENLQKEHLPSASFTDIYSYKSKEEERNYNVSSEEERNYNIE